jgi:hypothetical protein
MFVSSPTYLLYPSSFPLPSGGADVLSVIIYGLPSKTSGPLLMLSQLCCYIFTFANLVVSIPVVAIIVRYNIANSGLLPLWGAHCVAVGMPWCLSLVFYAGNQLNDVGTTFMAPLLRTPHFNRA